MEKRKGKKTKFNPNITKIQLNHEQAVLMCVCYAHGYDVGANRYSYDVWRCTLYPAPKRIVTGPGYYYTGPTSS